MSSNDQPADRRGRGDLKEAFVILAFGLVCGGILVYQIGVRDYDALTLLFLVPIVMLATAKGFRYGAVLSVICGAVFGTLILLRILQGTMGSAFILHNLANLGILIGFGFALGIVAEYFRFGLGDQWRQETTIIENFVPDEETGLYNFKSFRWMLRGDLARLKRYGRPLSTVFIRITNLDEFRKRYEELDEIKLFRDVSLFLRKVVRESDYIGRYSDDEIAVSLPETNQTGCEQLLARMRQDRDSLMATLHSQWQNMPLKFQISHANFPKDAKTLEEMVDTVDARYENF